MYFILHCDLNHSHCIFLWYFIYHVDVGTLNNMLNAVGLKKLTHAWLLMIQQQLCGAIWFHLSCGVGLTMIIFMTQLSTIPKELYEAAVVDGATSLQVDLKVYLPLLKPAFITNNIC